MKKILVIEDDEDIRFILSTLLKSTYNLRIIDKTELFPNEVSSFQPDLIITDNFKNDAAYFHQLINYKKSSAVPVILFSGMVNIRERAEQIGTTFYLEKPASIITIRNKIAEVFALAV